MDTSQRFEKTAACPTNEALLAYRQGAAQDRSAVAAHLAECEFCALAVELLRAHADDQPPSMPPMPPPVPAALHRTLRRRFRQLKRAQLKRFQ